MLNPAFAPAIAGEWLRRGSSIASSDVGDVSAGQNVGPLDKKPTGSLTAVTARRHPGRCRRGFTVGLRPSFVIPAAAHSHPDCRAVLILIVAPQSFARTLAASSIPREILRQRRVARSANTPIIEKSFPGMAAQIKEQMKGMVPMKRWGTTEEIAKAVLFLAFDATFTTGAELPVDGGWSQL